jgi:hypothetical protein
MGHTNERDMRFRKAVGRPGSRLFVETLDWQGGIGSVLGLSGSWMMMASRSRPFELYLAKPKQRINVIRNECEEEIGRLREHFRHSPPEPPVEIKNC